MLSRRQFLGSSAAVAGALAIPKLPSLPVIKREMFAGVNISYRCITVASFCEKGPWCMDKFRYPADALHHIKKIDPSLVFVNSRPDPTSAFIMRHNLTEFGIKSRVVGYKASLGTSWMMSDRSMLNLGRTFAIDAMFINWRGHIPGNHHRKYAAHNGRMTAVWDLDEVGEHDVHAATMAVSAAYTTHYGLNSMGCA